MASRGFLSPPILSFEVEALRFLDRGPVDLAVARGECVSVTGASGSGKTLLLRALADLDPHEGWVRLNGIGCTDIAAPRWRHKVGMLPADSAWWAETIAPHFPSGFSGATLAQFGFDADVLGWTTRRLSTGERQRLALARLLARDPEVLLLDEPTASLDPDNVARTETTLATYRAEHNASVIWVSHDPAQVARVASRHFEFRGGRLLEQ